MTWFDLLVIGLMSLSILFATFRGISREITTLAALGIGTAAAVYLSGPVGSLLHLSTSLMNNLALIGVLFLIFFLLSLVSLNSAVKHFISHEPGRVDRVLGAVFGFLRGWLLVGLGFLAFDYYFEADRQPNAISNAATLGFAQTAADILESLGLETVAPDAEAHNTQAEPTNRIIQAQTNFHERPAL